MMAKQIPLNPGKTLFCDLYKCLNLDSEQQLNNHKARLFPLGKGTDEVSTTSIFLASLSAVKEYREELLSQIGILKVKNQNIALHTYTEISDKSGNRPDGLIVLTSGKKTPVIEWAAFVEAKVGGSLIDAEQIGKYIDSGKQAGITEIISISNQLVTLPTGSPVKPNTRKKHNLYHWSWVYLKVTASHLIKTERVIDSDHIYILNELHRYFTKHKNISNYGHMGKQWTESLSLIHEYESNHRVNEECAQALVTSYQQEEKDVALQLTDRTPYLVQVLSKGIRAKELENQLQTTKIFKSNYMLNGNTKNTFTIEADLIRHSIICSVKVAITKGKAQAQTTSLLKMFEGESGYTDSIIIEAYYPRNKKLKPDNLSNLLHQKKEAESYSILNKDLGDTVKFFEIKTKDLLGKDFRAPRNFIIQLEQIAERFLTQVVANIKN